MKPGVARAAVKAGAKVINDVAANRSEVEMWKLVAEFGTGYVVMHMRGTPATMQQTSPDPDIVQTVGTFFTQRMELLTGHGVSPEQIVLDVGLGFGKTPEESVRLLAAQESFHRWKRPLLLGASRKSFIGAITDDPVPNQRLAGSLACACWAVANGVQIVRVHDVAATRRAVRMTEALRQVGR